MKTQLTQLSLLDTQQVSGGFSDLGVVGPSLDPQNTVIMPGLPRNVDTLPYEYITLAIHENGGKTNFIF